MNVATKHPDVTLARMYEWRLIKDCLEGEFVFKQGGERYLPKPTGFNAQGDKGEQAYAAYVARAQFPGLLAPSVSAMLGIIHGQEIVIEKPDGLDYLDDDADGNGLPLAAFHKRITRELLTAGAYGVLVDMDIKGGLPRLVGYVREALINWDADWFVLDETTVEREGFNWNVVEQYRVLSLEKTYIAKRHKGEVVEDLAINGRGGAALTRIPFTVGNAADLSSRIISPPLIGVANAAKAIYQLSADHRLQLYMTGQETLVTINAEAPELVGAGVVVELQGGPDASPDMKYVSPSCVGIEAHERAMQANREAAVMAGARLIEQASGGVESGEAKRLRYASETATLTSIAQSSCAILERALKDAAMIAGLPEDDIVVTPPKDLIDRSMSPQDFAALHGVYVSGGMSWETFYENGLRGGIFPNSRTSTEEEQLLDGLAGEEIT